MQQIKARSLHEEAMSRLTASYLQKEVTSTASLSCPIQCCLSFICLVSLYVFPLFVFLKQQAQAKHDNAMTQQKTTHQFKQVLLGLSCLIQCCLYLICLVSLFVFPLFVSLQQQGQAKHDKAMTEQKITHLSKEVVRVRVWILYVLNM